ncbi:MAG TPA: response regulator [Bacteroidia bacterium]|jgi:DNA-binding response OmpR family regulator
MKKILLIEDNNYMRENAAEILELAHYDVRTAANGKIGVEVARKEHPDLIICDVMMPVLDGYDVLHMLGKNSDTAGIPFIFLTAKTERSDMRKGMEMGADDYVTKPFDDIELLNAVESRLKKHDALRMEYSKGAEGVNQFLGEVKGLEELKRISGGGRVYKFKKKEVIFREGHYLNGLYHVNSGKVKTLKANEDGKELITNLYKEGDFFGYTDLLEETACTETAAALEDTEVSIIPKEDFYALIYRNSEVSKRFIRMLANDLVEKENQLIRLAYNSVRKRVAEALLTLQKRYSSENSNFKMAISREDVANLAGTSTETAIRTLSDFKEEKLIEIKGSTITIMDVVKLEKMKN